jgi:CheY-like chemotaxis protein
MQSPIEVLLVEDDEADVNATKTGLRDAKIASRVHVVRDGEEAMAFLNQDGAFASAPRPDVTLLDLNLPKKDGFQVLEEMKARASPEEHLCNSIKRANLRKGAARNTLTIHNRSLVRTVLRIVIPKIKMARTLFYAQQSQPRRCLRKELRACY